MQQYYYRVLSRPANVINYNGPKWQWLLIACHYITDGMITSHLLITILQL